MSSSPPRKDPLRAVLEETQTELDRRLHEACEAEAKGIATSSSEEIRDLEDALLAAAAAARQTRALRERLTERTPGIASSEDAPRSGAAEPASGSERAPAPRADATAARASIPAGHQDDASASAPLVVREFTDASGRAWRAWPVTPGAARASGRRFLGDFHEGWICFEALDNSGRRRLPCREPRWADLDEQEILGLLDRSIDAPIREPRQRRATPGDG